MADGPQIRRVVTADGTVLVVADDVAAWLESDAAVNYIGFQVETEAAMRRVVSALARSFRAGIPRWRNGWVGPPAVVSLARNEEAP